MCALVLWKVDISIVKENSKLRSVAALEIK